MSISPVPVRRNANAMENIIRDGEREVDSCIVQKQQRSDQKQQMENSNSNSNSEKHKEKRSSTSRTISMKDYVMKLALWYTRNFTPILSHDQLQPIMATLGFLPLPLNLSNHDSPSPSVCGCCWMEYYYFNSPASSYIPPPPRRKNHPHSSAIDPPCPRLPYPRIDGLHIYTYRAFLDALNFYFPLTSPNPISDIFHVRGMPLQRGEDQTQLWRCMDANDLQFVHCEVSFDPSAYRSYQVNKNELISSGKESNTCSKGEITPFGIFAPLDDIIRFITRPSKLKTSK